MNEKQQTPRPCIVKGTPCKFYMFVRNDKVIVNTEGLMREDEARTIVRRAERRGIYPPEVSAQVVTTTEAIIEWPDGRVTMEPVEKIRFPVEKIRFTDATDRNVGDKADEWIPVERGLPAIGVPVLVYVAHFRPGRRIRIAAMTENGAWETYGAYWTKDAPAAWRPMPEPPEREEVFE